VCVVKFPPEAFHRLPGLTPVSLSFKVPDQFQ
jgi:hypothetical protein